MLVAMLNDGESKFTYIPAFCVDTPENEGNIADYLYNEYGENLVHPINRIPYFMEASAWCVNGRSEGDKYEAVNKDGNIVFTIEIVEQEV